MAAEVAAKAEAEAAAQAAAKAEAEAAAQAAAEAAVKAEEEAAAKAAADTANALALAKFTESKPERDKCGAGNYHHDDLSSHRCPRPTYADVTTLTWQPERTWQPSLRTHAVARCSLLFTRTPLIWQLVHSRVPGGE